MLTDSWNNGLLTGSYNLQVAATPSIAVVPTSVPAGSPDTQLNIGGANLLPPAVAGSCNFASSQAYWGPFPSGVPLATTVGSGTAATATVPAALLTTPGIVQVMVQQPGDGGAGSNFVPFMVLGPALSSLLPASVTAGAASFTLTASGSNFVPGSQIVFGGTPLATTFVNSGSLTATVSTSQVNTAQAIAVTVVNPGGSTTAPVTFMVIGGTISSLAPSSVTAGAAGFTLTVNGSAFVSGSQIVFGGTPLATTFVNSGVLTAPVSAALVSLPGQIPVTVVNPGPMTSPPSTFTVNPNPSRPPPSRHRCNLPC